jgi:hypothetical protein
MEWVAIDVHIAGDAVTHRLAEAFRLRVPEAAGLLALAFAGMAQHAQDGELAEVTDSQIEAWAMWHGKRGAFATFFRAQLCDERGCVRAWEKYNGAAIREAKASRERMAAYRAAKRAEREANGTQNGTAYHTPNGTENGTRNVRRTGQDQTRPNQELTTKGGGADAPTPPRRARAKKPLPAWADALTARWLRRVGKVTPERIAAQLGDAVEQHGETAVLRAIDAWADARVGSSSPPRLEWFAEAVSVWVERAGPLVDADGILTERGLAVAGGAL